MAQEGTKALRYLQGDCYDLAKMDVASATQARPTD